jgi:hypothetical protein
MLSDLGFDVSERGIKFRPPSKKIDLVELDRHIARLCDDRLRKIGIDAAALSDTERRLILSLPRNAAGLKVLLGYAEESRTHTIETIVYNIRKKMGADFIKLDRRGEYYIDK